MWIASDTFSEKKRIRPNGAEQWPPVEIPTTGIPRFCRGAWGLPFAVGLPLALSLESPDCHAAASQRVGIRLALHIDIKCAGNQLFH